MAFESNSSDPPRIGNELPLPLTTPLERLGMALNLQGKRALCFPVPVPRWSERFSSEADSQKAGMRMRPIAFQTEFQ